MKAKSQDNSDCFKWLNEQPKACYLWLPMESPATGVQSLLRRCSAVCLECGKRVPMGLRQFGRAVDRSWPIPRDVAISQREIGVGGRAFRSLPESH